MMTWQSAKVAKIEGNPRRADGRPVMVGDDVDKEAIDGITGGTIELDRVVAFSFRFPVAKDAPAIRARPDFAPKPPAGKMRIAGAIDADTPPALPVEVDLAPIIGGAPDLREPRVRRAARR